MTMWDRERALDEMQGVEQPEDIAAPFGFDLECSNCGSLYEGRDVLSCRLCGCDDLRPVEDLTF